MPHQALSSNSEDPLADYSGLSLFVGVFASHPNPPRPSGPDDLYSTHNFLKSMSLQSHDSLLEQAKAIVESSSSELMNCEIPRNVASAESAELVDAETVMKSPLKRKSRPSLSFQENFEQGNLSPVTRLQQEEAIQDVELREKETVATVMENSTEQRPVLSHKQGRFSVDPNSRPSLSCQSNFGKENLSSVPTSQQEEAVQNVELREKETVATLMEDPSEQSCFSENPNSTSHSSLLKPFDVREYKDPNDLCDAYERHENTSKEIGLPPLEFSYLSKAERKNELEASCWAEQLAKSRATCAENKSRWKDDIKKHYPDLPSLFFQENFEKENLSPIPSLQEEAVQNVELGEKEIVDARKDIEKLINFPLPHLEPNYLSKAERQHEWKASWYEKQAERDAARQSLLANAVTCWKEDMRKRSSYNKHYSDLPLSFQENFAKKNLIPIPCLQQGPVQNVELSTRETDATVMEDPTEQRLVLRHKRGRFSVDPNSSDLSSLLNPFDVGEHTDPNELCDAYERLEGTTKEIVYPSKGEQKRALEASWWAERLAKLRASCAEYKGRWKEDIKKHYPDLPSSFFRENFEKENLSPVPSWQQEEAVQNVELREKETVDARKDIEKVISVPLRHLEPNYLSKAGRQHEWKASWYEKQAERDAAQQALLAKMETRWKEDMRKKSACNTHYSDLPSLSFQENFSQENLSPVPCLQQEKAVQNGELQEKETVGSVANGENFNELLSDLLSHNYEDLVGDGVVNLLQERLQIEPTDIPKFHFPEWLQDIPRKIDLKSPRRSLSTINPLSEIQKWRKEFENMIHPEAGSSAPSLASRTLPRSSFSADSIDQSLARNASPIETVDIESDQVDIGNVLSMSHQLESPLMEKNETSAANASCELDTRDMGSPSEKFLEQNLMTGISSWTPQQEAGSLVDSVALRTLPKSPLASTLLLREQRLQSHPIHDSFSADNIGQSPVRNTSPIESVDKQSDQVDVGRDLDMSHQLESLVLEKNGTSVANASCEVDTRDFAGPSDKFLNDGSRRFGSRVHVGPSGSHADFDNNTEGDFMNNEVRNDDLNRPESEIGVCATNTNCQLDNMVHAEDAMQKVAVSSQTRLDMEESTVSESNSFQREFDRSNPTVDEVTVDKASKVAENIPEQHDEQQEVPESSGLEKGKRSKRKRMRNELSRRQSLSGFGTRTTPLKSQQTRETLGVVRRSTRIRSRPLEFWKGERFLYGRIHESLTTVIGIKYASPSGEDGKLKVKSYVSEDYQDLVEKAASLY